MAATDAKHHHDYHLVNPSPWPVIASISALDHDDRRGHLDALDERGRRPVRRHRTMGVRRSALVGIVASAFVWWRDVIREGQHGDHTPVVQLHFRYGMILFIASEVMFFVAWFWAYFDAPCFPQACTTSRTAPTSSVRSCATSCSAAIGLRCRSRARA